MYSTGSLVMPLQLCIADAGLQGDSWPGARLSRTSSIEVWQWLVNLVRGIPGYPGVPRQGHQTETRGGQTCRSLIYNKLYWWRRTQRSRTAGEIPVEVTLLGAVEPPLYQQIALNALGLHQLGLNASRIAKRLGVTDRTVAKALRWLQYCRRW